MSHTLRKVTFNNTAFADTTIVDYVQGGEPYTLAELGLTGGVSFVFFLSENSWSANSQIHPRFDGINKVILEDAPGHELASTVGLNLRLVGIIHGN